MLKFVFYPYGDVKWHGVLGQGLLWLVLVTVAEIPTTVRTPYLSHGDTLLK